VRCPDPQQLSLADEIQDDFSWDEWFRSLPLDPDEGEPVSTSAEAQAWPEKRAA
jgi:hypothetical protein